MAEYKGGGKEGYRHSLLEKQRQAMLADFDRQKKKITKDSEIIVGNDRFVSENDGMEATLKKSTVGLVKLEDFQRIRENLEEQREREAAKTAVKKEKKTKKRKKYTEATKLSFDVGDDEEEVAGASEGDSIKKGKALKKDKSDEDSKKADAKKLTKNPFVDTSFLPDRDRDAEEAMLRESLRQEWLSKQEKIKKERIQITYSYWDGSGHRKQVECSKGDTIAMFLEKCREQVKELRGCSVDSLMYIKEDLIIPHHYTFYEFIVNKARGKSGPLFSFDVHEDIRMISDATVEKDESHAGKVCERSWYERNKHIFPASRWEIYDPEKDYGKYSIKGS
ncbi:hypothetical protein H4219_000793 [Mycoemilia scoparia]|uniref:FAM50A/XAP5 C-terminal domain-containing protein n=1 Tax=Mycoemilia scoparia TaxID=417184 RepID=A0A9W8DSL9_9FUNG|nr:hypothetical protein H4219_000793 [Mycoemilia scoparia]